MTPPSATRTSDPPLAWVRAWVAAHDAGLSGLSRREALKHL